MSSTEKSRSLPAKSSTRGKTSGRPRERSLVTMRSEIAASGGFPPASGAGCRRLLARSPKVSGAAPAGRPARLSIASASHAVRAGEERPAGGRVPRERGDGRAREEDADGSEQAAGDPEAAAAARVLRQLLPQDGRETRAPHEDGLHASNAPGRPGSGEREGLARPGQEQAEEGLHQRPGRRLGREQLQQEAGAGELVADLR